MNLGSLEPYYSLLLITRQIPSVPTVTVGQTASQCFPAFRLAPVSWSHQWNYRGSNRSNSTGSLLVRVATSQVTQVSISSVRCSLSSFQYEFVHSLGTTSNSSTDWGKQSSSGWRFFRNSLHFFFRHLPHLISISQPVAFAMIARAGKFCARFLCISGEVVVLFDPIYQRISASRNIMFGSFCQCIEEAQDL